jgi:predicted lipoprotein with Yx(FWY)xxD motif
MPHSRTSHSRHQLKRAILPFVAILAAAGLFTSIATAQTTKRVVKEANNPSLGKRVLTANNGLTLYALSAEKHGTFICKGSCLKDWHPLVVAKGVKPAGPVSLGTIKRPDDGARQVTFEGRPLYTFDDDKKKGDANGEGFKDVGTWHVASVGATSKTAPSQPMTQGGYGSY